MAVDIKGLLAHTFLALCSEKSIKRITVTELLAETGVGRRTFYVHFRDKNDLIRWIFDRMIVGALEDGEVCYPASEAYYRALYQYKLFVTQSCRIDEQNCLKNHMYEDAFRALRAVYDDDFFARYHATGVVRMTIDWILSDMKEPPETFFEKVRRCLPKTE